MKQGSFTSGIKTDGLIKITDEWGGDVRLDEADEYDGGWSRKSVQATWDSENEIYLIAAKETYVDTWGSEPVTNEDWLIFEVDDSGVMSWDSMKWNVNIAEYEDLFDFDLNDDGDIGVNLD